MITLIKRGASYNSLISEIDGLSSETKPVTEIEGRFIENGSVYTEIDTGKKFMYDKENTIWHEIKSDSGGDSSEYAHSLELTINSQTYVLTATLKNTSGEALGTPQTVDLPLETMVINGTYDNATKKIILTLKNGNTVEFSVADLVSGLQSEITSANKLDSDLINDTNQNNKFVTSAEKTKIANALTEEVYNAGKTIPYGTQYVIEGETYTVEDNAEVFNNYDNNKAVGECSHAEGGYTKAIGAYSHAEGGGTTASRHYSHAEGVGTTASGECSHTEGSGTKAIGGSSHAEGSGTTASGHYSHAEGVGTTASGECSHTEGSGTKAIGAYSHAEGGGTTASGNNSHAEGSGTIASSDCQHAQGKFNIEDLNDKYAFIIGNGTNKDNRSNAFAVDWNGLIYVNNASTGVNVSQLQPIINSSNKISADFIDDSSSINKFGLPTIDIDFSKSNIDTIPEDKRYLIQENKSFAFRNIAEGAYSEYLYPLNVTKQTTETGGLWGCELQINSHYYASIFINLATFTYLVQYYYLDTLNIDDSGSPNKFMSVDEKAKLAGIETGANKITVDSALDSTSVNPVGNSAIYTALSNKVNKVTGKQLSTEDFTTAEKTKLAGLQNYNDASCIKNIFGTPLANGDDLNTYTDVGTYACTSGAVASSLINCPYTGSGFRLDVIQTSSVNFLKQIVQPNQVGTDSNIYHRTYAVSTNSWSVWYRLTSNCKTIWEGTQSEYEALVSKNYDLYMIYEENDQNGD